MSEIMDARCRLCAECSSQISIIQDMEFCSKIFHLFQIKVSVDDNLPTSVCNECYEMVEKTWSFNDKIQKAQDILAELVKNIQSILPSTEELEVSTVTAVHTDTGAIVDLNYIGNKDDFLTNESLEIFSDNSLKPEIESKMRSLGSRRRKVRTSKHNDYKGSRKEINILSSDTPQLENIEFQVDLDDAMIPKQDGWSTYPFECFECQQLFSSLDDLKLHYTNAHNTPLRYLCADCPKSYTKYSVFLAHARVHRARLRLCCDICYKWFPTASEQEDHRLLHGDDRRYICPTCGKTFIKQCSLVHHGRSHLPAEIKNQYQCDQCPKKFGTKPNLLAHARIHAGIRDYTCDQCGKSFIQKGNLDNHLLTHTAIRPFNCNACGKSFKTIVRLRKHSTVHSGHKPHRCDICGRQFRERGTLKEHHRIHTGALPFTCEFCGKCFRFKGVLTTHRRQHTGERPYSCNECQHHFTNWPNYNKHMKRRHGINTSVTCRTRQDIPPTGMPHRNPPGTILAPPQPVLVPENFGEQPPAFYPVLNLYTISDELMHQRV